MSDKTQTDKGLQKAQGIGNPVFKRLYTLKEAAIYLGRKEYSVRDLVWKQALPVVKEEDGRKLYIDIEDLNNYIKEHKAFYC